MTREDLGAGARLDYDSEWLPADQAEVAMTKLLDETRWEQCMIRVGGREIAQPRLTGWASELPYRYSGLTLEPREPTPTIAELFSRVSEAVAIHFNHTMLNRYRNGRDGVAMHADAELELGRNPTIAALSLGASRRFVLRAKGKRRYKSYRLAHGSLLVMGGTIQHRWRHGIPKQPTVDEERINLTFRHLLGPPGCRSRTDD